MRRPLPEHMQESITRWVDDGILPGSFLTAILSNDLVGACLRADDINQDRIRDYVIYLYNDAPSECFGSPGLVERWQRAGGLNGFRTARAQALEAAE